LRQARRGPGGHGGRHGTADAEQQRLEELLSSPRRSASDRGQPPKAKLNASKSEAFPRVSLKEAGIGEQAFEALGQRFLGSNHIRRPRRVCKTMCG
jgi:hypothetical protein